MTPNCDDPDLESVVKIEAERFEDEFIKEKSDQISNCFVYVFDVLKPDIELRRLDAKTIARWTKEKTRRARVVKSKIDEIPQLNQTIGSDCFSCDVCPNWFSIKSSLKKHMYCHQSTFGKPAEIKNGRTCPFCFKKVEAEKFDKHKSNHKQSLRKKSCPTCGIKISRIHFKRHLSSHEKFNCRECKMVLKSLPELKEHMSKVHYGGKGHECFCGKIYKTLINLRAHQSGVHVKNKNLCEICGEEFESYIQKFRHWKAHHLKKYGNHGQWKRQNGSVRMVLRTGGPYICDLCGHVCRRRNAICEHFKMRHGPKRMLTCDLCGKKYESKSALIAHMQSWHMKHTFGCDICGRNFSLKRYIRQHMGTHNRKTKCEICRKLVSNMKIHIAARHIYKKKKKLSCPICGLNQTNLKKHINARHVEKPKPFKCDECEENFLYKFERLEHQRKKHGFKTFRCHCGFRSDCATRTRDHKKVHTGKTPTYLCLDCGAKYATAWSLKLHRRKVHLSFLGRKKTKTTRRR